MLAILFFAGRTLYQHLTVQKIAVQAPDSQVIKLELADNDTKRWKGLSGRESVQGGMLFVYPEESQQHCLTMRDMQTVIDMVWLDSDKKIITIHQAVQPSSYPKVFCPLRSAKYAIELPAGDVREHQFSIGKKLHFNL